MAGRKSGEEQVEHESLSFEGSIVELQSIVGQLEDGSLPLEESMQQFERGISLLRNCYQVIEQAEQRIEVLTGWPRMARSKPHPLMQWQPSIHHRVVRSQPAAIPELTTHQRTTTPRHLENPGRDAGRRPMNPYSDNRHMWAHQFLRRFPLTDRSRCNDDFQNTTRSAPAGRN